MTLNINFFFLLKQAVKNCLESYYRYSLLYVGCFGSCSPLYGMSGTRMWLRVNMVILFQFLGLFSVLYVFFVCLAVFSWCSLTISVGAGGKEVTSSALLFDLLP